MEKRFPKNPMSICVSLISLIGCVTQQIEQSYLEEVILQPYTMLNYPN